MSTRSRTSHSKFSKREEAELLEKLFKENIDQDEAIFLRESGLIDIIWNEYQNHHEWQRHNENQRAQLTNILLIISAALLTFIPSRSNHNDWPIPTFIIIVGVIGFLAVMKYWERFNWHLQIEMAYGELLDKCFVRYKVDKDENKENAFRRTRNLAMKRHESSPYPLLKNNYFMQHWLWQTVFALITILGITLLFRGLP